MLQSLNRYAERVGTEEVVPLIRRGTFFFLTLLWLFAALAAVVSVWLLIARSEAETQATAESLEQYARRNIELSDFVADQFIAFLDRRGGIAGITSDPGVTAELRRLNARLPEGSAIIIVNTEGWVTVSTQPIPARGINLSDRRWFKAHVDEGVQSLIGPAIKSRVVNRIIFTYTKSYAGPDGRLLGIVNLGIPSDSLVGLTPNTARTPLALVKHQGELVAAQPVSDAQLGKPFALPVAPETEATLISRFAGQGAMVTVKNLPEYELYAIAAMPLMVVLEPALWSIGLGALALALLSLAIINLSRLAQRKSHEVEQALADNRVLFQEVHHRVKNNLQVISSLIRLQTDRVPEEFRPFLEQTAARVRAIAMVHEQIYSASSPSVVQLDAFLRLLIQQLETSMVADSRTRLSVDLEPVAVPLDRAVPVALLATEALTNALKHGVGQSGGAIAISLRSGAEVNTLKVCDDGPGTGVEAKGGLGTQIMTALSRQIDGSWSLTPGEAGGTCFTLKWPAGAAQTTAPALAGSGAPTRPTRAAASSTVILR